MENKPTCLYSECQAIIVHRIVLQSVQNNICKVSMFIEYRGQDIGFQKPNFKHINWIVLILYKLSHECICENYL